MTLTPGTRLDGYEILGPLGAGGMGEVYRARDATLKRDVAIKVLPEYWSRDPERLRRFEQEAQATAALSHPNIVSIFHVGQYNGSPYIVTELLQGESLRDRLRKGPLRLREAIDVGCDIARGLAAAHDSGIVHRDLKPENIWLTKDGRVKILDFGLAKLDRAKGAGTDGSTVSLQQASAPGHVLGTVGYMSPEQVRAEVADPRSDIFAAGAVLYEMLTGKPAFHKATSAESMTAILHEDPPPMSQLTSTVLPGLQRIVNRCLAKNPAQRFHHASDLAFALEAVPDSARPSDANHRVEAAKWQRRTRIRIGAALLILLGAGLLTFTSTRWLRPSAPQEVEAQRITANAADAPVTGAVISPDGKYITYSDPTGVYIRQVDSGETRPLALPKGFDGIPSSWFPDSTHLLLTSYGGSQQKSRIWKASILGGEPQTLLEDAVRGAVSPDGNRIAFFRGGLFGSNLWMADADGGSAHQLFTQASNPAGLVATEIWSAAWSPNGERIAYIVREAIPSNSPNGDAYVLFTCKADGSDAKLALRDRRMDFRFATKWMAPPVYWAPNGRLYFALRAKPRSGDAEQSIWSIAVDQISGKVEGQPHEVLSGSGLIGGFSSTLAGSRMIFWRSDVDVQVFLSEFDPATRAMSLPRRLTFDQSVPSAPVAWTADSESVVYVSKREGKDIIYRQRVDQNASVLLAQLPKTGTLVPRLSGDGSEILYGQTDRPTDPNAPIEVMAVPIAGGTTRLVLKEPGINNFLCARPPTRVCILNVMHGQTSLFYLFDPKNGTKGRLIAELPNYANWGLSPDGIMLALHSTPNEGRLRFVSIQSGATKEVLLKDWPLFRSVDWSADSKVVLIASVTQKNMPVVLGVDIEGNAKVLLQGDARIPVGWVIPSWDGKYGGLAVTTGESNVWMLEHY